MQMDVLVRIDTRIVTYKRELLVDIENCSVVAVDI